MTLACLSEDMPLAIAHFAVGAMATALLLMLVAPRLLLSPTVVIVGGVWAMIPDAHNVLPVGAEFVHSLHHSTWSNLFWFHHFLDRVDPTDSTTFAAGAVLLLLVVVPASELVARFRTTPGVGLPVEDRHG